MLRSYQINECYLCNIRRNEISRLLEENRLLKSNLERLKMNELFLSGDNEKVRYHTGLPDLDTFNVLLNALAPHFSQNLKFLSPYQKLLLTLMWLKLNLPFKYLIYLFQINRRTAEMAFTDTVSTLYTQISHVVHWPCREEIQLDLHGFFEPSADEVIVIVDIFEIYTVTSALKYLISASPQGYITFVSKAFEGNVTNEEIIEKTGILEILLPGDLVLADGFFKLEVNPDGEQRQLKALHKHAAVLKKITLSRVAVKQAVLNIQRFALLSGLVPLIMLRQKEGEDKTLLDKVVKVCCAITNMWPPKINETNTQTLSSHYTERRQEEDADVQLTTACPDTKAPLYHRKTPTTIHNVSIQRKTTNMVRSQKPHTRLPSFVKR
ncbi:hypothetical protein WMY93_014602 [Mugilogobius chulae]|uniref:DDE Tnp4 domain-containing protein n=1 Tax=Mugilogobius chulae TaxID=88201 RepID=A0AAW0P5R2_9GOBI